VFDALAIPTKEVEVNWNVKCGWLSRVPRYVNQRVRRSAQNATLTAALRALLLLSVGLTPHALLGAPALVSVSSQTAAPGSSVILLVAFQSNGEAVGGVQFDIQYDNSAMSLFANLGDAAKNSGKLLYEVDLAPNIRRFLIVGLNSNLIASGTLISLFVNLSPNAPVGVSPLAISNGAGADPAGVPAAVASSDGAVTVVGTVAQSAPLQLAGVLNGASFVSGPLAPGEIFTLVGSDIGSLSAAGTQVLFDGIAATLFYVATNQINGITPFELAGRSVTQMQITTGGQVISNLAVPVAAESPAIFTLDGSGVGQGAILNQDATVNSPSNPAVRGTIISLYATGSGPTNPAGADGQIAGTDPLTPTLPVSVQIGGVAAEVLYAGTAPGLSIGVLQVNCRVPANVIPGYSVSIALTVGSVSSAENVTLAVQ
jgi:uncharacterized protein (TIGR03437 family)